MSRLIPLLNRITTRQTVKVTSLCQRRFISSRPALKSIHNDFRYSGTEKNAGALQDLLRRVMEIDADITNTPLVEFKPNTQECMAYCMGDTWDLKDIRHKLEGQEKFKIQKEFDNLLHILDHRHGGDIYLFKNGALVYWGLNTENQSLFMELLTQNSMDQYYSTRQRMEYIVDEDEVTDIKGDMILLNPSLPSIELSKIAFSYAIGRVAKLKGLESIMDEYLDEFFTKESSVPFKKLLFIYKKLVQNSQDGFLGTPDLHWAKPELEECVNKVSKRFDVHTRIAIINKKLDLARQLILTASIV